MPTLSQAQKIIRFFEEHRGSFFTARQIAEFLVRTYTAEYARKRANPRFADDQAFLSQIAAEIGAQKDTLKRMSPALIWQDRPKPRRYCLPLSQEWGGWPLTPGTAAGQAEFGAGPRIAGMAPGGAGGTCGSGEMGELGGLEESAVTDAADEIEAAAAIDGMGRAGGPAGPARGERQEQELYPLFMSFLASELHLYAMRIRETCSSNTRGRGGNQWLHPDIVALETVDRDWSGEVRACARASGSTRVRLWSFEVKKTLTVATLRQYFFQAVSNSSWAHEGYLVATALADERVEKELRMLSSLHGIGVILLDPENPSESDIVLPAQRRPEADWQSVDRLSTENADFSEFIERVSVYLQTGRLREKEWGGR